MFPSRARSVCAAGGDVTDWDDKAFSTVGDLTKQIITLSTGIIALTITFFKDFAGSGASSAARNTMTLAWVLYTASIVFGLFTMMAVAGNQASRVNPPKKKDGTLKRQPADYTVYLNNVRIPGALQILSFFTGVVITIIAGHQALK
jgi:hypothetical protein